MLLILYEVKMKMASNTYQEESSSPPCILQKLDNALFALFVRQSVSLVRMLEAGDVVFLGLSLQPLVGENHILLLVWYVLSSMSFLLEVLFVESFGLSEECFPA